MDQERKIKQLASKVLEEREDWKKHIQHSCLKCQNCNCGRHRCKIKPSQVIPKSSIISIYRQDYVQKKVGTPERIKRQSQPHSQIKIIDKSIYKVDYPRKKAQRIPPMIKLPTTLEVGGPAFISSTYQNSFKDKPIKPSQPIIQIGTLGPTGAPMKDKSTYRDNYNRKNIPEQQIPIKQQDNIKLRQVTFDNQTCYKHDYIRPNYNNTESCRPKSEYIPTKGVRPQSSYRTDYNQKVSTRCPAQKYWP